MQNSVTEKRPPLRVKKQPGIQSHLQLSSPTPVIQTNTFSLGIWECSDDWPVSQLPHCCLVSLGLRSILLGYWSAKKPRWRQKPYRPSGDHASHDRLMTHCRLAPRSSLCSGRGCSEWPGKAHEQSQSELWTMVLTSLMQRAEVLYVWLSEWQQCAFYFLPVQSLFSCLWYGWSAGIKSARPSSF